MKYG
ncbi:hypothetical protein R5R35_001689 [Gryllus longicercus]|jgi:hypothetical protein